MLQKSPPYISHSFIMNSIHYFAKKDKFQHNFEVHLSLTQIKSNAKLMHFFRSCVILIIMGATVVIGVDCKPVVFFALVCQTNARGL